MIIQRHQENSGNPINTGDGRIVDPIGTELSKPCSCGRKLNWRHDYAKGLWEADCCGNTYTVIDAPPRFKTSSG